MKKKRRTKSPNLAKIGEAIVKVAASAKDVMKVAVLGLKKKAMAATKSPKKAKRGAKVTKVTVKPRSVGKKAAPTKKAGTTKSKKKR